MTQTIVFISGWGTDSDIWDDLKKLLGESYKYMHFSWSEYLKGNSSDVSLPDSSVVIAWSLGALIAQQLMVKENKVSKLILLAPTARMVRDKGYKGVNARILQSMIDKLDRDRDTVIHDFALNASLSDDTFVDKFIKQSAKYTLSELRQGLEFLRDSDLRNEISEIAVNTLIVHGNQDMIIPVSQGIYVSENMKNSKSILLDAGHALLTAKVHDIAKEIQVFLCT